MISILNIGMGNLASIQNMFRKVGASSMLISSAEDVAKARVLVMPGVGKFDNAIQRIDAMGLRDALAEAALSRKIPILGICLGMQLMTRGSEEGRLPGLGWVRANARRIDAVRHGVKVPHMGWNTVTVRRPDSLFELSIPEHRFYFVHSYAVYCDVADDVLASTWYGDEFASAFSVGNITGVQFHPEKSHRYGASLLRRFALMSGAARE